MTARWLQPASTLVFLVICVQPCAQAQSKPIGSVATADAAVDSQTAAAFVVASGRATLTSAATVTARPGRNADVALNRGGDILVCQTTALHLTASNNDSLLLALDRGALELRLRASPADVLITPDLRLTLAEPGILDLRLRVTFNGDTCVENRGRRAPALNITDAFGETAYLLKPGQHVMFERGNLRTVMDHESTPCGCPPEEKPTPNLTLADSILNGGQSGGQSGDQTGGQTTPVTPQQAAALHPFPTAVSDGLAAPAPGAPETPGTRHVQVAGTLTFDPADGIQPAPATAAAPTPAPLATPPDEPEPSHNPLRVVGRFFKRLFVR